jgi:outer membrane protein OmpA-like peptidoglycan-associated protein
MRRVARSIALIALAALTACSGAGTDPSSPEQDDADAAAATEEASEDRADRDDAQADGSAADDPDGDEGQADGEDGAGTSLERREQEPGTSLQRRGIESGTSIEAWVGETLTALGAERRGEDTVVSLPDRVLFDFDDDDVKPEGRDALDELAEVILHLEDTPVRVAGHTDSRGDPDYNQRLSERRAEAVVEHLVGAGVEPSRLVAEGFGETQPVAPNETEDGEDDPAGRAANRRVEIVIEGFDLSDAG